MMCDFVYVLVKQQQQQDFSHQVWLTYWKVGGIWDAHSNNCSSVRPSTHAQTSSSSSFKTDRKFKTKIIQTRLHKPSLDCVQSIGTPYEAHEGSTQVQKQS